MKFVPSLVVDRVVGDSKCEPLWPDSVVRLVLIVVSPDGGNDTLLAYGVDPIHETVVFETSDLQVAQLSAFIKAVIDGSNAVADADGTIRVPLIDRSEVVVIPDPPPPHTGPKLTHATMIQLAVAIAANVDGTSALAAE